MSKTLWIVFVAILAFFVAVAGTVDAQARSYHFERQYTQIWINQDGTIDLIYDLELALDSGQAINFIQIGQPNGDFTIGEAVDQSGNQLATADVSSGDEYLVQVNFIEPLMAGNSIRFSLTTNVGGMIYNDTQNPGNLGMQFTPTWWSEATVRDLRIQVVLPETVSVDEAKTTQEAFWNSTSIIEDRVALYWEKQDLPPDSRYPIGVSFPASALPNYMPPAPSDDLPFEVIAAISIGVIFTVFAVGAAVYVTRKKKPYVDPKVSMESLGIRRGLTAVEASYLLGLKPVEIVTEILYSLLHKRAVWVEDTAPTLKLRIMPEYVDKKGPDEDPLRYYEIDFLAAVKSDGTLDEEKLAKAVMFIRDTLEQKLKGYSRKDTVNYYRKIVDKAWIQVEQAGTEELASKMYDEQLLWLMLDSDYKNRTQLTFKDRTFTPNPLWFWYWYGYAFYYPRATYQPNINAPTQSAQPPTIPGAEFANTIATSIEKTSNTIVANIEKFANAIVPPPPQAKTSHEPSKHRADCVCACAACACACACVSCACACAGGGVG